MADRNNLTLVGRIGGKLVERKSQSGTTYLFFPVAIEAKETANSTQNNAHQDIHVMVFRKPVIDYLKKVGAREGNRCVVFGFISSYRSEIKGKLVTSQGVNAHEVYIIKVKADNV